MIILTKEYAKILKKIITEYLNDNKLRRKLTDYEITVLWLIKEHIEIC